MSGLKVRAEQVRERLAFISEGLAPLRAEPKRAEVKAPQEVELLAKPRRFGAAHVGVVALALLVALGGTWLWFGRSNEAVVPLVVVATSASAPSPSATATPMPGIFVHVIGAVKQPGVVELPAGARVAAAIKAAGGLLPEADPAQLNLAAHVVDGAQIIVGTSKAPKGEVVLPVGGAEGAPQMGAKVNLNTASQQQLESLPGVGPATAKAILAWRQARGPFRRVQELQEVDGIGPKSFAKLAPLVDV